jgi:hypothetical protein
MIDNVTVLHRPKPPEIYFPGGTSTFYNPVAKWTVAKSRRDKGAEIYQDLRAHPWMDITQAARPFNRFAQLAFGVDRDMHAAPATTRLRQPASAVGPIVVGRTLGGGASPFGPGGVVGMPGDVQQNIFFGRDTSNYSSRWETPVSRPDPMDLDEPDPRDTGRRRDGTVGPARTSPDRSHSRVRPRGRSGTRRDQTGEDTDDFAFE